MYFLDRLDETVVLMISKSKKWRLQEAKNKFSEVVRKASEKGPQTVTKHGKDSLVVLLAEDYRILEQPETSLIDFFQKPPLSKVETDLERDKSPARSIEL